MEHIFNESGLIPDPLKVEAIAQMTMPKSKLDLQRLLGMILSQ